jgi:hypothetical protein
VTQFRPRERWPLDDLAGVAEIAEALGVGKAAVANWAVRYSTFPQPLVVLAGGPVYSLAQVVAWDSQRPKHPKRRRP